MTNPQDQQRNVKVVLLGQQNVGKTSLLNVYVHKAFRPHYSCTIGSSFSRKVVLIRDHIINFHIWDTAGLERYDSMTKTYYRNAAAAIVCFDLTEPGTLEKAKEWVNRVRSSEENCMIYLCGTKRDILQNDNEILMIAGTYAEEVNVKMFLTSCVTGENIDNLFDTIAQDYLLSPNSTNNRTEEFIRFTNDNQKSSICCSNFA